MKVFFGNKLVDSSEANIPLSGASRGPGHGIYDALRTYGGRMFGLNEHLERLRSSCALLRLQCNTTDKTWADRIAATVEANSMSDKDTRIRLTLFRRSNSAISDPALELVETYPIDQAALDAKRAVGVRAITASQLRAPGARIYNAKSLDLLATNFAMFECADAGVEEGIFCNTNGEVCEATFGNVFVVRDGKLSTPPLSSPCLPGVTRAYLLKLVREHGMEVEEKPIPVPELTGADEVFTCSCVSEMMPVIVVNGKPIGTGKPGPVAAQLQEWYRLFLQTALSASQTGPR